MKLHSLKRRFIAGFQVIGIYGNEKADNNAKSSFNLDQTDFKVLFNNFKLLIN